MSGSSKTIILKFLKAVLLITWGTLSILLLGNVLIHLLFYLVDGTVDKFLSQIWVGLLMATALISCSLFYVLLRGKLFS
jgi:hypothetical protein